MPPTDCIFCKIIRGDIPSFKLIETSLTYSFLDIQPTSAGHCLIIPKFHASRFHQIPDQYLADILPVAKKLALVLGLDAHDNESPDGLAGSGYNLLQNNGSIAHQEVPHVHFHLIPKNADNVGLKVGWPAQQTDFDALGKLHEELKKKLEST